MGNDSLIKSVAIIGAGASGAVTASAFAAEDYFHRIRVFERRDTAGGTWIYDPVPPQLEIHPGRLPPDVDPPLDIPESLPAQTAPNTQERFQKTPVYSNLTTNVPHIAMSFSDRLFSYGPFTPHYIPRQYIENYFSVHRTDSFLVLGTTVEDVSSIKNERWKLTLRKHDAIKNVDVWWEEEFDAVIFGNGHYSVPFVPEVKGLEDFTKLFPNRVVHSKVYRDPTVYSQKSVLVIGNSASGMDVTRDLVSHVQPPLYQSRRTPSRWDGDQPPKGIVWKPVVREYLPSGRIIFSDDTYLDNIDTIIYCTGYQPSFPFWNIKNNNQPLWDYTTNHLTSTYLHTFHPTFPTLGIIGVPRVLTFRSFEYQAIALARVFSRRNHKSLPPISVQKKWQQDREKLVKKENRRFHDIAWETGETMGWLGELFEIAGLPTLKGEGRVPPVLKAEVRWAIENIKKYPDDPKIVEEKEKEGEEGWVVVRGEGSKKDLLSFI